MTLFPTVLAVLIVLFFVIIFTLVPIGLWISAISAGVRVRIFGDLVAMRLRRVPPSQIVRPQIEATKAGLSLSLNNLEAHYLAGGQVANVVSALIAAEKANIDLKDYKANFSKSEQELSQKETLFSINKAALNFFHKQVFESQNALDYLQNKRKLSQEQIVKFKL